MFNSRYSKIDHNIVDDPDKQGDSQLGMKGKTGLTHSLTCYETGKNKGKGKGKLRNESKRSNRAWSKQAESREFDR